MKATDWTPRLLCGLLLVCLGGCAAAPTLAPTVPTALAQSTFTLYQTPTLRPTALFNPSQTGPAVLASATPQPAPTLTPRTHVVKAGEDMGGIALRYRVPLKDLMAANPTVNPRLMLVGTVLIVPGSAPQPSLEARASATPQPVRFETPRCLANPGGGSWCLMKVLNPGATALINVTVLVRLANGAGTEVARQTASLPLDLLPAGGMLPLMVFFGEALPSGAQVGAQLAAALPASAAGERYPALRLKSQAVEIAADGKTAGVSGQLELVDARARAAQAVVVAAAYDEAGQLVAVRQWQSAQALPAGQALSFQLQLYALGGSIRRVELFVEARN